MAATVPGAGWAKYLLLGEEQDATAAREGDVSSRLQQLQLLRERQSSVAAQAADQTMAHYNRILHEYIVRAYDRADRGELWRKGASAADRLRALQGAIKDELLRAGLRRSLVATWSLYNSNLFNAAALRRDAGRDAADTPVLVTLNCAPVDDGGSNISASSWTPDYARLSVDGVTVEARRARRVTHTGHDDRRRARGARALAARPDAPRRRAARGVPGARRRLGRGPRPGRLQLLRRGLGLRRLPGVRDGGAGTADPRALFEDYARRGDGLLGPPRPRAGPGPRGAPELRRGADARVYRWWWPAR